MEIGGGEIILIIFTIVSIFFIGNYGRDTALGYTGSVLLCFVISPIFVYFILMYMKRNQRKNQLNYYYDNNDPYKPRLK